jgi:hypothetical protein
MTRLYSHNSFHLIRAFQICANNELQLQVFNGSLRLHSIPYTVEHGSLFNGITFRLITVSETAGHRHRWEICLTVMTLSWARLIQPTSWHHFFIFFILSFLFLLFVHSWFSTKKNTQSRKFLCLVIRSTCPFHLPVILVHTLFFIKWQFLKFNATQHDPAKPRTHRQRWAHFNISTDLSQTRDTGNSVHFTWLYL